MNEPDIHHRRSIRLRNYDYSQTGAYSSLILKLTEILKSRVGPLECNEEE